MRTQFVGLGMMMVVGAAALVSSARAEGGRPSRPTLEAMGLGSLVVMSDDDAMGVRGQGYHGGSSVAVSGNSFATINGGPLGGAHSENAYSADGKHSASGSNSSYAGVAIISTGGGHKDKGRPSSKPNGGGYGGGMPNGGGGGYGGGKPPVKIQAIVFFAGGHSSAHAW